MDASPRPGSPTSTTGDAYARARAKQQGLSPAPAHIYQSWVDTLTPREGTVMAQNPIVEKMALSGAVGARQRAPVDWLAEDGGHLPLHIVTVTKSCFVCVVVPGVDETRLFRSRQ